MSVDIDQFIREQKSKIASERNYLTNFVDNNSNTQNNNLKLTREPVKEKSFMSGMQEGENMKSKYKQELRNEYSVATGLNSTPNSHRSNQNTSEDGLLHGLRYSNSASRRKEKVRNNEYNEFKRLEEEKFNNRFASKKNPSNRNIQNNYKEILPSTINNNPISSSPETIHPIREFERRIEPERPTIQEYPRETPKNRVFESKLEELERKVEDLRNFRIQNPFIVYPTEILQPDYHRARVRTPERSRFEEVPKSLRYSTTNLGMNHMKTLDDAEGRLKEIEDKYVSTKSQVMKSITNPNRRPMPVILDDENLLEEDRIFGKSNNLGANKITSNKNNSNRMNILESGEKSIIPLGHLNESEIKHHKQEQYRLQLQQQMKEKEQNKLHTNSATNEVSFFDRFGQDKIVNRNLNKNTSLTPAQPVEDNEYMFYASHNPLEGYNSSNDSPNMNRGMNNSNFNSSGGLTDKIVNRNYFDGLGNNYNSPRILGMGSQSNNQKENYGDELKRQIEEQKLRKEYDKKRQEEYDRRKNEEISLYNPFGKGGGGAPLKDDKGQAVADLRRVLQGDTSPRDHSPIQTKFVDFQPTSYETQRSNVDPEAKGYARGGHGIFGQALTKEDKDKAGRYKEELQMQIDLKRRQKEIEKETERLREEKELARIEKQQKEIQIQMENEKKLQQQKELERQKQLEESQQAALEEKKRLKQERNKIEVKEEVQPKRYDSPREENIQTPTKLETEAAQRPIVQREDSRILSQIMNLRNQLQNERIRIENALLRQKDNVEIYDPRLEAPRNKSKLAEQYESTPIEPASKTYRVEPKHEQDVFQAVLDKKGPLTVRRHQKPKEHPLPPSTPAQSDDISETDLDAYLKEQEKILARMNQQDFSKLELAMPKMNPHDLFSSNGYRPNSAMSRQLDSDSDFIRYYQSNEFNPLRNSALSNHSTPDLDGLVSKYADSDKYGTATANPKAPVSRRSSVNSLNIDELTRKNKERLRKLQKLQDDNDSSHQSSDDILNRFIANSDAESDLFNFRK